jgi:hypothetical protein
VRMQSVRLLEGVSRHLIPFTNGLIWMMATSTDNSMISQDFDFGSHREYPR